MSNLSPQAQAVLDAIYEIKDPMGEDGAVLAAALRAAADQVVPPDPCGDDCCIETCERIRSDILAIANELDTL